MLTAADQLSSIRFELSRIGNLDDIGLYGSNGDEESVRTCLAIPSSTRFVKFGISYKKRRLVICGWITAYLDITAGMPA
jgi:hypothetical protein